MSDCLIKKKLSFQYILGLQVFIIDIICVWTTLWHHIIQTGSDEVKTCNVSCKWYLLNI